VGVELGGSRLEEPNLEWWPLLPDGAGYDEVVGEVRSAVWSPRLERNIGLAMVLLAYAEAGTHLFARTHQGARPCTLTELPFARSC